MSAEETKITQALRDALRKYPAAGAHEPNAQILKVEPRPTFGVGSVRMPSNALVDIKEGAPRFDQPAEATIRFIELCRDFLIPVLEEKKVNVDGEQITVRRPIKDENGRFKTNKEERCFNRVIIEPVLKCTPRLADHIDALTPEKDRTANTRLQAEVEGFYACTDESENTFITSAVLEKPRDQVKQIVSQLEIPFDIKVPASGLSEQEAQQILDRQRKRAAQRAVRGEPVIERAIDPSSGRTVDQWGLPSFIISPEIKAQNRERYCPSFNQSIGCATPIPTPEPATEEEAVRLTPEEIELIAARQAAVDLPEIELPPSRPFPRPPGVRVEVMPPSLPAVETLSPEAQRLLAEMRRRPEIVE